MYQSEKVLSILGIESNAFSLISVPINDMKKFWQKRFFPTDSLLFKNRLVETETEKKNSKIYYQNISCKKDFLYFFLKLKQIKIKLNFSKSDFSLASIGIVWAHIKRTSSLFLSIILCSM